VNPVLAEGEIGVELDTGLMKLGDGSTAWTGLAYYGAGHPNLATHEAMGLATDSDLAALASDADLAAHAADGGLHGGPTVHPDLATHNALGLATDAELAAHTHPTVGLPCRIIIAVSDETTEITTGVAKVTFRMPFAMTLTGVRASLTTASSSGAPVFDVNEGGVSMLGTKLSVDQSEKTSTTAASAATITDSALADDAEITIDVDTAGTGAAGAKVVLIGTLA
jgi:hypothetical protein